MTDAHSDALDARLRENERVTALQGQTLSILVDDAKKHASKEVVEKLEDLTRNQLVPKVAVLESRMDNQPHTPTENVLAFLERMTGRPGFRFTLVVALLFGLGVFLYAVRAEVMPLLRDLLAVQEQTESNTAESARVLAGIADTTTVPPLPAEAPADTTATE